MPDDRLHAILDTMPALVWLADRDGAALYLNRRWLEYTGLSETLAADWDWMAAVHPEDRSHLADFWLTTLASDGRGEGEIDARLQRYDGQYRWFVFRAQPQRDASGAIAAWCGTHIDIDDRRRAEEVARDAERDLRLLLDNIPALVNSATASGEVDFANRRMLEYFGVSLAEMQDWPPLIHEDDRSMVLTGWQDSVATGQPFEAQYRLLRSDGTCRWFQGRAVPVHATGAVLRWYNVLIDIEDRKRAEDLLRKSEQKFRAIVDSIPGLVALVSPTGEIELVNKVVLDYFGRSLELLQNWTLTDSVHPDDLPRVIAAWQSAIATGDPLASDHRLRRADGVYRWFELRGLPVRDSENRLARWYCLITDIDDRKVAEDALERASEALRNTRTKLSRAAQIATVSELAASLAHEVNQPLAAVVANGHACLRWLAATPPNLAKAIEAAERIVKDGKDAGEVIRRVRPLFKRGTVENVVVDLNEVVREVLHLLDADSTLKQVSIESALEPDLLPVLGDRVQLQQLVLNLMLNGLEAVESVVDRPKQLSIRSRRDGDVAAVIEIADNGIGLKDPDRAFEPFYTTKAEGLGMGLAICRSIAAAHQGTLSGARNDDLGTTFFFSLPLHPDVPR